MRGTFLGSGGVQLVHLPTVISDAFGCSRSEARRLLSMDEVQLDDETVNRVDLPVDEIAGHKLTIGKETQEIAP